MAAAANGKSVELFRDMLPSIRRVGVFGHATNPVYAKAMLDEVLIAGRPTGIEIHPVVMVRGPDDLEGAFSTMKTERADALVVQGSLAIKPLTDLAIKYGLPAASTTRVFVDIGGLMSFGADGPASFRHGARFVQKILQGKHPQDLPIEQPQSSSWPSASTRPRPWGLRYRMHFFYAQTQWSRARAASSSRYSAARRRRGRWRRGRSSRGWRCPKR